jgi:hypothetical protein
VKWGRWILLALLGCAVVLAAAAVLWPREREPVYNGRTLSEWIDRYKREPRLDGDTLWTREEVEAIRQIGTNALPHSLRWLTQEDGTWRESVLDRAGRAIRPLNPTLSAKLTVNYGYLPGSNAAKALIVFRLLGPTARSAIPELARLVSRGRPSAGRNAIEALCEVGEEGLPTLMGMLTNSATASPQRIMAAYGISKMGTNVPGSIPFLVSALQDKTTAHFAAIALSSIRSTPELAVPVLIEGLQNNHRRVVSIFGLGSYGELARPAVPALTAGLSDTNAVVRGFITNAFLNIAPEVLGKRRQ